MRLSVILLMLMLVAPSVQAETRYIVDQAKMPMRAGQSTSHKILRMLPSGMAVELLEQASDGYSRIRTSDGREGWILSRYLMQSPAARSRLEQMEKELASMHEIKAALAESRAAEKRLTAENATLSADLETLRSRAADTVTLLEENGRLKEEASQAHQALASLRESTDDVVSQAHQRWFMLGGGAVLIGILLGLLLPYVRLRKKRRWGGY